MSSIVPMSTLLRIIADALSEQGENHEYDRACVEIACETMSLDMEEDTRDAVLSLLRTIKDMPSGTPDHEIVRIYRADREPWDVPVEVARDLIAARLVVGVDGQTMLWWQGEQP